MEVEIPVAAAKLYKGKVIVWDEAQANQLYQRGFFGKPLTGGKLLLAPVELLYLLDAKRVEVADEKDRALSYKKVVDRFIKTDPELMLKYAAYADLRSRGYIIKTGLKFGAHFRVYDRGEQPGTAHSKFLIQAVPEGVKLTPTELARAVRLAHSVRKKIYWAVVDEDGDITYYLVTRERP